MEPLPALTRAQLRELDRRAIEELSVPSVVLMENAGRGAARAVLRAFELERGPVAVLCGRGNNGGDGYVLARHLDLAGVEVVLLESAAPAELSPDAAVFREVDRALGLTLRAAPDGEALERHASELGAPALLVDGLLGTGFHGRLRAREAGLLEAAGRWLAATGAAVVALDLPSGMDADSGLAEPQTLRCARTLTFAAAKVGFTAPAARAYTGALEVLTIGIPDRFGARIL